MLNETRIAQETIEVALPPSRIDLEPGDSVVVGSRTYRIRRITDGVHRTVMGVATEPTLYFGAPRLAPSRRQRPLVMGGLPLLKIIDLPASESGTPVLQRISVTANPWPGAYTLWRSDDGVSYSAVQRIATCATVGETITPLAAGPLWRFDRVNSIDVELSQGALQSVSESAVLSGANLIALGSSVLGWEIIGFANATLIAAKDRKSTRLNSSHRNTSRMPSSA